MRDGMTENVGIEHHDNSYNRAKRDRMPRDEAKDNAFVAHLLGSRGGNRDGLRIHHFAHHSSGAVGRAHQNWIDAQLLSGDSLQTSEERVGGGIAAGECNSEPAEKRAEEGIKPSGAGKGEAQHGIEAGITGDVAKAEHE